MDEGRAIAVVQVGRSLEEHQEQLRMLVIVLIATAVCGLALAAAGGLFVAGRALRPVREAFARQRAFVADASHELRTPLTLLRGNAELVQMNAGAALSAADVEAVKEIVRQTGHIERLISDMSTLARMDEGQLLLQPGPVNLGDLLIGAAEDAKKLADGKPLDIRVETEGNLQLIADEARVRQVLLALVDNAVRYTPDDGTITLRGVGTASSAEVTVSDTGPGIPADHIARVFERFYRADTSRSRGGGGTGLGLAIGRAIAEAHGGTLTASNATGMGQPFTLRLPRGGPASGQG
jgi:signal transduction histidine kinase